MNKYTILLMVIILVGFGLRAVDLNKIPAALYWDETAIGYDAYSVSETGQDMHGQTWFQAIFPSYGDYKLPMMIWLTALTVKLGGPTIMSIRLVSALAGTVSILLVYWLAQELFRSKLVGIYSALAIAFSPWAIQFSRAGFEANAAMVMVLAFSLLLFKGIKHYPLYLAAGIIAALGVYSYFSVRFVIPLIFLCFLGLYHRRLNRRAVIWLIAGCIIYTGLQLPIYTSGLYQASNQYRLSTPSILNTNDHILEQNYNRDLAGNTLISRVIYHRLSFLGKRLGTQVLSHLNPTYLFFAGDSNLRHSTGKAGLFLPPVLIFLAAGILIGLKNQGRASLFLIGWWLAALIPAAVPLTVPHALRSLNAMPAAVILTGYGASLFHTSRNRSVKLVFLGLMIWFGLSFLLYWHDYRSHYPSRSAEAWQYGYAQLASYLGSDQFNNRDIYLESGDRLFLYFLLYNQIDPRLIQGKSAGYQFAEFKNFHFGPVSAQRLSEIKTGDLWAVETGRALVPVKAVHLETITNLEGKPIFEIYEKTDL